ncbi:MAG: MerR family DNA-binding transcriptional regulator [Hyphomonadaceae bacterium]|nr:MerR family DNA-binding transcriptional regulator [Hyphomonadaceae bacterium]
MNIGEAAHASGVSAKMLRYYEAIGLIQPPKRRPSGYRQYELPDIHRLRLIRIARDSGFSLVDIRDILALWDDRKRSDADTKVLALAKVRELKQRVEQIEEMIDSFRQLIVQCERGRRPSWPLEKDLKTPARRPRKTRKP